VFRLTRFAWKSDLFHSCVCFFVVVVLLLLLLLLLLRFSLVHSLSGARCFTSPQSAELQQGRSITAAFGVHPRTRTDYASFGFSILTFSFYLLLFVLVVLAKGVDFVFSGVCGGVSLFFSLPTPHLSFLHTAVANSDTEKKQYSQKKSLFLWLCLPPSHPPPTPSHTHTNTPVPTRVRRKGKAGRSTREAIVRAARTPRAHATPIRVRLSVFVCLFVSLSLRYCWFLFFVLCFSLPVIG
jgi:hypothetical protein